MNIKTNAPAALILCAALTVTVVSVVSYVISHRMVSSFEKSQFNLMGQILQSRLSQAEQKAIASAEIIAAMPGVQKSFAARNRDELLTATKEGFRIQQEKYGISQAQFHLAPATSFLRVHNPEKFGEDLISYRKIVAEVNESKSIRKGTEITTSGIGIFGTLPMVDAAGKHTGSFEMAYEFGPLLDELKKDHGFELALFVDEKLLKDTATSLKGDIFNDQNRVGRYVKFYSTHPELTKGLVNDGDVANVVENQSYIREAGGAPQGVLLQPLYNYTRKQIGVVMVAQNFGPTRSADGQAVVWQILLGLLSFIALTGAILVVVRGMILRPVEALNARVSALADAAEGEELPAHPDANDWPDEMRDLAASCEKLTHRAADAGQGSKA